MSFSVSPPHPVDPAGLAEAIEAVRNRLLGVVERPPEANVDFVLPRRAESTLAHVCTTFALSPFESTVLVLAAAVELLPDLESICAQLHGDPARNYPSFGLAMAVFPDAHWSALTPEGPLRGRQLIELGEGAVLTHRPLRIAERVLHALMGNDEPDPRLARRAVPCAEIGSLPASYEAIAERVAAWLRLVDGPTSPALLWGNVPEAAIEVALRAASLAGAVALRMDASTIPSDVAERDLLARLWIRELALRPSVLVLTMPTSVDRIATQAAEDLLVRLRGPIVAVARESPSNTVQGLRVRIPPMPFEETLALWRSATSDGPRAPDAVLHDLSAQFNLGPGAIRDAARQLRTEPEPEDLRRTLWNACRALARPRMADLAQRVEVRARMDDLVLPDSQRDALAALIGQVRRRATVFHAWGFADKDSRGVGTSAVFAGPSGTGKTMAAEVIAAALELDLYCVDLSAVVSKYIGETEENLRRVFDAAEAGGAVLLFDEADALFGKRTEVRDSHDRHANIEVSYLLQRMEAYTGLAILTTNLRKSMDDAFLRRVQFIVEFPFPDARQRRRIWERIFPSRMPRDGLDYERLAQLSVAGGNIRSIARNAAHIAADDDAPVGMRHVLRAARLEFDKLGRSLPPAEIRGWV